MQILPNETRGPLIKDTSKVTWYGRNQSDTRKVLRHTQDVNKRTLSSKSRIQTRQLRTIKPIGCRD